MIGDVVVVWRVVEVVDVDGVVVGVVVVIEVAFGVVVGVVDGVVWGVVVEVVLVVAVDVIGVVVVFEDSSFELEKPKPIPRPTPVNSNIIDNDARINLLTTKKSRYLSSIHRYSLDKCQIGNIHTLFSFLQD